MIKTNSVVRLDGCWKLCCKYFVIFKSNIYMSYSNYFVKHDYYKGILKKESVK